MNTRDLALLATVVLLGALSVPASAQVPPFFNGGGAVAFEPEIDTVTTGAQMVVAPTVSHDRKYVTIGGQFQNAQLLALQSFRVSQARVGVPGVQGVVGSPRSPAPSTGNGLNLNMSRPATLNPPRKSAVLHRPGMTRVVPMQ